MFKLLVVLLSLFSSLAIAEEGVNDCDFPLELCKLQNDFNIADKELNETYRDIINSIKTGSLPSSPYVNGVNLKKSLILSQRAWLQFKDANCESVYVLHSGGAQRNHARLECETDITKTRTHYLKNTYR